MIIALLSVSTAMASKSAGYGVPVDGYPSAEERALVMWTNAARVDPTEFTSDYKAGGCTTDDFSSDEKLRYSRHFVLPGFGPEGQAKLKAAKVAVVGAGGLIGECGQPQRAPLVGGAVLLDGHQAGVRCRRGVQPGGEVVVTEEAVEGVGAAHPRDPSDHGRPDHAG